MIKYVEGKGWTKFRDGVEDEFSINHERDQKRAAKRAMQDKVREAAMGQMRLEQNQFQAGLDGKFGVDVQNMFKGMQDSGFGLMNPNQAPQPLNPNVAPQPLPPINPNNPTFPPLQPGVTPTVNVFDRYMAKRNELEAQQKERSVRSLFKEMKDYENES